MSLIFDTETNGLLDETTEMHCLVIYDTVTDTFFEYNKNTGFEEGINKLNNADEIAGHNIVKFDIPVMQKLFGATFNPKGHIFDTLLMSKLVYPDIGLKDDVLILKNKFPKVLRGKYSLRAWGIDCTVIKVIFLCRKTAGKNGYRRCKIIVSKM